MSDTDTQVEDNNYIIPSDPETRKKIKAAIEEASVALTKIEDQRSFLKDLKDMVHTEYQVPKKTLNKMIKAYHKHAFTNILAENEEFQSFYESIIQEEGTTNAP